MLADARLASNIASLDAVNITAQNRALVNRNTRATDVSGGDKAKTTIDYPRGKAVKDKIVGDYNVYENEAVITVTVEWPKGANPAPLEINVKLQACNEKTCLLPATIKVGVP